MKLTECMIAWNVNGKAEVGPYPDRSNWSRPYEMTGGGCFLEVQKLGPLERSARVLSDFVGLVVRDGVNPQQAHAEFSKIDEYRNIIPEDVPLPKSEGDDSE